MIQLKRIYEKSRKEDGVRVLADRLWPRGLSRGRAKVDLWLREIAPSDALRKWFSHDSERWEGFQRRYLTELKAKGPLLQRLKRLEKRKGAVTLVYGARDNVHNNAVVLAEMLRR